MVRRPAHFNTFEFVVVSALRTKQLLSGCVPLLPGTHKPSAMAQMEVAAGRVARSHGSPEGPLQCEWQL